MTVARSSPLGAFLLSGIVFLQSSLSSSLSSSLRGPPSPPSVPPSGVSGVCDCAFQLLSYIGKELIAMHQLRQYNHWIIESGFPTIGRNAQRLTLTGQPTLSSRGFWGAPPQPPNQHLKRECPPELPSGERLLLAPSPSASLVTFSLRVTAVSAVVTGDGLVTLTRLHHHHHHRTPPTFHRWSPPIPPPVELLVEALVEALVEQFRGHVYGLSTLPHQQRRINNSFWQNLLTLPATFSK